MHFAKGALLFLSIALGGCASSPPHLVNLDRLAGPRTYAWDGLGRNPNLPRSTTGYRKVLADKGAPSLEREKILTSLRPNSAAWWAVHDEIEADHDRQLARKLVICSVCLPQSRSEDLTGAIPAR